MNWRMKKIGVNFLRIVVCVRRNRSRGALSSACGSTAL